jgi:hypothetical protein
MVEERRPPPVTRRIMLKSRRVNTHAPPIEADVIMLRKKRKPNMIITSPVAAKTLERSQNKRLLMAISYTPSALRRRAVSSGVIEST